MTIIRKRFTHTLLPALLAAFAGFAACSSDDDAPEPPKPSGYDIYTAGYTTPASKAVATVWKNGQLLYTLTDGTNDAWAYAVCVSDGTVYAAGYERQGDRIVAKVWENGTLKYTPGAPGADSYAYSVFAANGSLYTAGSEESGGALTAVDDEAVEGVADADAPRLGVADHGAAFRQIAVEVEVGVDDARPGFDHGYAGVFAHEADQSRAAARDE